MISYNDLGEYGRLGNHMFHYASTIGVAHRNNYSCEFNFEHKRCVIHNIFQLTKKSFNKELLPKQTWREPSFHCSDKILQSPDNVALTGNLQCFKYFETCFDIIRNEFRFNQSIEKSVHSITLPHDYISVHVRRTDYLQHDRYVHLNIDWYRKAMSYFPNENFIIFSDDLKWCKSNLKGNNIYYSPFLSSVEDMYAMTIGKGNIIANSTFSWWSAFLNKSSQVICPKKWFTIPQLDENNLILENWITI